MKLVSEEVKKVHIVSFDVPYPPDYGGVIDVFYKIRNLFNSGVKIWLHCFEYGREHSDELEKYCEKVYYYKRKTGIKGLSFQYPYMLYSRRDKLLLDHLLEVDAPILFEGVHTCYYLNHPALHHRFKILRNQNVEQEYFSLLARREGNLWKKIYFLLEGFMLRRYERRLHAANLFMTVSRSDFDFFSRLYPNKLHHYIPSFHHYDQVQSKRGLGSYALYHGNLGHVENIEAAKFLLKHVVPHTQTNWIFAGRNPNIEILNLSSGLSNCTLIANPSQPEMEKLVLEAQVNVLPTFQPTGLKLKLLYALFSGRHVVVNKEMIKGTDLGSLCNMAQDAQHFVRIIEHLTSIPFSEEDKEKRKLVLNKYYNNNVNAAAITHYL